MQKTHKAILLAAILLVPVANAEGASWNKPPSWNKNDTMLQAGYYILHTADWAQTRYISEKCNSTSYYEKQNTILGPCPDKAKVNQYFILTGILHYAVSQNLPQPYRRVWQMTTISMELGTVEQNLSLGIKLRF